MNYSINVANWVASRRVQREVLEGREQLEALHSSVLEQSQTIGL
jgi:hypothetical protein